MSVGSSKAICRRKPWYSKEGMRIAELHRNPENATLEELRVAMDAATD